MRVTKAVVHIELPCTRCGNPCERMGLAAVLPDGRIGEPIYVSDSAAPPTCNACTQEDRNEEKRQYSVARQRAKWAKGKKGSRFTFDPSA